MSATSPIGTETRTAKERIAEEHRALAITESRIEATADPNLLLPLLEELHGELARHFAGEEESDGIRADVSRAAPYLLDSLSKVFDEHGALLAETASLRDRTRALIEEPLAEILGDVAALLGRLREHEEKETEVVRDAFYTDVGGGS